jgi:type IV secretion system protein VirB9
MTRLSLTPLCFIALLAMSTTAAAAGKERVPTTSNSDVAALLSDAMSPINPYNTGVDPMTMPGDARMAVFPYSRDQIFRVMTAPMKTTTIELAAGEHLVSDPALGDSVQWVVDTDGANHIFVKPTKPSLVNTMHLSTNLREYDMTLVSSPLGGLFYQSVRFRYPQSLMAKVHAHQNSDGEGRADSNQPDGGDSHRCTIAVSPERLNFDYTVSGSAPFKPETVFDDGKFVWIRLPADAPFAVPTITDHGDVVTPNFNRCGQSIVVQQLADKIVLAGPHGDVTITRGRRGLFGL